MESSKNDDFVSVAIRVKPLSEDEESCLNVISYDPPTLQLAYKQQVYTFDHIFTEDASQENVYNELVKPMVERVVEGYNCTVFAYGQTGTGKTYTIGTDIEKYGKKNDGLISRALADILTHNDENKEVSVSVSFCEIYNEKVYDLMTNNKTSLIVKGFKVVGLSNHKVENINDAKQLLLQGSKNRHFGETKQNLNSSRSHAIFSVHCIIKSANATYESKLNLVDLAGSESVKKTGNEGNQLFEGININKGLLCIGQVIYALSANRTFVPYRQSTITTMLQDSLNKNNYVSLIACVAPDYDDIHETTQTLDFSLRAKKMKNRPELNNLKMLEKPTPRNAKQALFKPTFSAKKPKFPLLSTPLAKPLLQAEIGQMGLSPIVRKCVDAVQSNIFEKLQTMMEVSRVSTRRSSRISELELVSTVSKIVKKQLKGHLSSVTDDDGETTSDFVESKGSNAYGKFLDFNDASTIMSDSPLFKIPEALPKKSKRNSVKTSSPIQVRRSVRLSLKRRSNDFNEAEEEILLKKRKLEETPVPKPRQKKQPVATPRTLMPPPENMPKKRRQTNLNDAFKQLSPENSSASMVEIGAILNNLSDDLKRQENASISMDKAPRLLIKLSGANTSHLNCVNMLENVSISVPKTRGNMSILNAMHAKARNILNTPSKDNTTQPPPIPVRRSVRIRQSLVSRLNTSSDDFATPPKTNKSILKTPLQKRNAATKKVQISKEAKITKAKKKIIPRKSFTEENVRRILHILNEGTVNELCKLNTIGVKSAQMLLQYRKMIGRIDAISDLKDMPWRGNCYKRFLEANFLNED